MLIKCLLIISINFYNSSFCLYIGSTNMEPTYWVIVKVDGSMYRCRCTLNDTYNVPGRLFAIIAKPDMQQYDIFTIA